MWCGAGAVHAAAIASAIVSRGTVPGPNDRIVRRAEIASSGDSRNRSCAAGRTRSRARPAGAPAVSTPRTRAAGTRAAFPITMPAAAAT